MPTKQTSEKVNAHIFLEDRDCPQIRLPAKGNRVGSGPILSSSATICVLDREPNQASAISERFLYRADATKVELYLTLIMMEEPDGALIRLL